MNRPTLLSPAGDWKTLITAVKSGADALYFGLGTFNMRARAGNFGLDDLGRITDHCKKYGVATHLALNTIVFEKEAPLVIPILEVVKEAGIDMVITWDFSVIEQCRKMDIPFCVSTQASVCNTASARFYEQLGAKRIVLARECSLEDIRSIVQNTQVEIETFIHGAMCVAISGRCLMSQYLFNKSGNRGECLQPCRREYEIRDPEAGHSLVVGKEYVLSPKDICTIDILDQLIEAGIHCFKIEGRSKGPEYVAKVVSTYRKAIDLYFEGKLTDETKEDMKKDLATVYNRAFSTGFYLGTPGFEDRATFYGSHATTRKHNIGSVIEYDKRAGTVLLQMEAGELSPGQRIYIIGDTSGFTDITVERIRKGHKTLDKAVRDDKITIACPNRVQFRDQVYLVESLQVED